MRQHAVADITQVRRALGQQRIMQRLLACGRCLDLALPGRFGARPFGQARINVLAQRRVSQHGQMGTENLADARHTSTVDQALNLRGNRRQG